MEPINLRFGAVDQTAPAMDMGKSAIVCVTETSGSNPCTVSVGSTPFTMQVPANGMVLIRKKPAETIQIISGNGSMTGVAFSAATGISQDSNHVWNTSTPSGPSFLADAEFQTTSVDFSGAPALIIETEYDNLSTAFNSYPGGIPSMNDLIQFHWLSSPGDPIDTTKILFGAFQALIPGAGGMDDQLVVVIPPGATHPVHGHDLTAAVQEFEASPVNPLIKIELPQV